MKTAISLFFILTASVQACRLERKVVSLSGPMTHFLEELDLLKDPNLLAISKFHNIRSNFKGERLAGGIFLSPKVFHQYKDAFLFYDKSIEFRYFLKKIKHQKVEEIASRDQDPFEVINILSLKARKVLVGCKNNLSQLEKKFKKMREQLLKKKIPWKGVFFLGAIEERLPEMVISNDGFVMFMREKMKFQSYPSDLAYVAWSSKKMSQLSQSFAIGLLDGEKDQIETQILTKSKINMSFRGVFTPGIRQAYFLQELANLSLVFEQ